MKVFVFHLQGYSKQKEYIACQGIYVQCNFACVCKMYIWSSSAFCFRVIILYDQVTNTRNCLSSLSLWSSITVFTPFSIFPLSPCHSPYLSPLYSLSLFLSPISSLLFTSLLFTSPLFPLFSPSSHLSLRASASYSGRFLASCLARERGVHCDGDQPEGGQPCQVSAVLALLSCSAVRPIHCHIS